MRMRKGRNARQELFEWHEGLRKAFDEEELEKLKAEACFELRVITVNISTLEIKMIEVLQEYGIVASRSECIRMMLSEWLPKKLRELKRIKGAVRKEKPEHDPEEEDPWRVKIPTDDGELREYRIVRTG